MKIVWFARKEPVESQKRELRRLFPGHHLVVITEPFRNAEDIAQQFEMLCGDEMVAVAPLSIIQILCKMGYAPLFPKVEPSHPEHADIIKDNQYFKFNRFRRVKRVDITWEDFPRKGSAL